MNNFSIFNKILLATMFLLVIASNCLAQNKNDITQNKVDLELTVYSAAKSVRGGETFAYSITVRNIGSAKATNVLINQDEAVTTSFISYAPSKGTCLVSDFERRVDRRLHCKLTDLEVGETVVISVEMKIRDFGDISPTTNEDAKDAPSDYVADSVKINRKLLEDLAEDMVAGKTKNTSIGDVRVSAKEREENTENNHTEISVELLPSKNIPPRVKITSPKLETVVVRSSKKPSAVTFIIEASDPDGTIEKVNVNTQQFHISVEYPENKYVIEGIKYSIKEVEENMSRFQKYFGGEAVKTGKNTYTYTLENPQYSFNDITVEAIDNGGRAGTASVKFTVKDGNSIEYYQSGQKRRYRAANRCCHRN